MIFSKERLMSNWHLMRIVRLAIGLYMAVGAVYMKEWMFGVMGAFFLYQALADATCCGAGGCNTRTPRQTYRQQKQAQEVDVDYEEIK